MSKGKKFEVEKLKWIFLLFISLLIFLVALYTRIYILNLVVILLALYIYKNGDAVMFKEYNERQRKKIEEGRVIREATKEIIQTRKFLNKK
ncbi:hypothetical protein [uncultured Enterococcus sp.]|uniref:hypothetical protein n=1 Tax=uncultured Enterococcus sp. TaxID=167972 RepID=UPI0026181215|nr:hypothetical protein [uncultured Enterococcus sp.]